MSFLDQFTKELSDFVENNWQKSVPELVLQQKKYKDISIPLAASQIQAKQKAKDKLPSWFLCKDIIYPPLLNLEQCSSELTAEFKASLFHAETMADLTGGFGVDTYFFSKNFEQLFYVEQNLELLEIFKHNLQVLPSTKAHIKTYNTSAEDFLKNTPTSLDLIYLDPARRDHTPKKIFQLEASSPNIFELLPDIFLHTPKVLLKTSPMLDIHQTLLHLKNIQKVWVIAVNNECKEVLYLLKKNPIEISTIPISTVNLFAANKASQVFESSLNEESSISPEYSLPLLYLYEPNAAILKAGFFKMVAQKFNVAKLHPNSHLYTSQQLIQDFPGRIFTVQQVCKVDAQEINKFLTQPKASIFVRNFPLSVDSLYKKLKIKEGGEIFVAATTLHDNQHVLLILEKI